MSYSKFTIDDIRGKLNLTIQDVKLVQHQFTSQSKSYT